MYFTKHINLFYLERVTRIELVRSPWQGDRLPLHHTRKKTNLLALNIGTG